LQAFIFRYKIGACKRKKKKNEESNKKFSVLAVATGDGLCRKFTELGADRIISGGQTQNPSIEEFIKAFDECDTENIIVLPNNKNIILAARQAAEIYERAKIFVVETKNLMQGYAALSVITPGITDIDALTQSAKRAAESVICCEITKAVRDVVIDGREIKKVDYIAITDGKLSAVADTADHAAEQALAEEDTDLSEIITVFAGHGATEEDREALVDYLESEYPDCEVTLIDGGQEIYDYLIAIE
jgi:dihydroxyacetone kinase-like predicted kinase